MLAQCSHQQNLLVKAVILTVSFWITLCMTDAAAARGPHRETRPLSENNWLCPTVRCGNIPTTCENVEYIVMEYSYRPYGRVITLRCESCPYCLDFPFLRRKRSIERSMERDGSRRTRRSLYDMLGWTGINQPSCPSVACPEVPESCNDVRPINVILQGRHCEECPACFDGTIVGNHVTL